MLDAIKLIIDQYGMYHIHYAFMVFGNEPNVRLRFGANVKSPDQLKGLLDNIPRIGGQPNLEKALEKASELFQPGYKGERPAVRKFVVVIVDRNTVGDKNAVLRYAKSLENSGIKVSNNVANTLIIYQFLNKEHQNHHGVWTSGRNFSELFLRFLLSCSFD